MAMENEIKDLIPEDAIEGSDLNADVAIALAFRRGLRFYRLRVSLLTRCWRLFSENIVVLFVNYESLQMIRIVEHYR